jgi:DNA (cytosine-5)-methyltransferase 1
MGNQGKVDGSMKPTKEQIKEARTFSGLSQSDAAKLIHSTLRTWQDWEAGKATMHAGLWELFCIKSGQHLHS